MIILMDEDTLATISLPESFIGSMEGTMEIVGDIISPIDEKWDADAD
jgi:hypothetical protein